ncbi:hypothetical protein Tco_1337709 [Tanacetum coccineum]
MHQSMAPVRMSSGPAPFIMTPGQLKSGLAPTDKELEMLFQPMFDEHLEKSRVNEPVPSATEINAQAVLQEEPIQEDTPIIHDGLHPSHNLVTGDPGSTQSSSGNVNAAEPNQVNYPPDHLRRWTKIILWITSLAIPLVLLFKHVVSISPELDFDHYLSHDRAMHPLAPHYERKIWGDRGKKRPREPNASSSSSTLNHPSSSHPLNDSTNENDDESSHSNPSSSPQNTSSSSNNISRVHQKPPHERHYLNTYLFETINLQTQQRDAHREGLRSIRQALKNMMGEKQK